MYQRNVYRTENFQTYIIYKALTVCYSVSHKKRLVVLILRFLQHLREFFKVFNDLTFKIFNIKLTYERRDFKTVSVTASLIVNKPKC